MHTEWDALHGAGSPEAPAKPNVSVIVPVYNGQDTIRECLESLLRQEYPADRLEIIVVHNASRDRTVERVQPFVGGGRIRVLHETGVLNAYGARNTGAKSSTGVILAFTDADCRVDPAWVTELVKGFDDPMAGCVVGEVLPAPAGNTIQKYWDEEFLSQARRVGTGRLRIFGGNCAYRRATFEALGGFRDDACSGADAELASRMTALTGLGVRFSPGAVVRHHNVSRLTALLKQGMRYGISIRLREQFQEDVARPSVLRALRETVVLIGSFAKRWALVMVGRVPVAVPPCDRDIYLWRPCLRILNEWAVYAGFKFARGRPELVR